MDNVSSNKDDPVHSHNPIEWITEGEFKVVYIEKAPIKVKSVYFNVTPDQDLLIYSNLHYSNLH